MKYFIYSNGIILSIITSLMLLLLLFSSYPYVFCQFLPIPPVQVVAILFLVVLSIMLLIKHRIAILSKYFLQIVLMQCFVWFLYSVYHSDSSYITRIVYLVLALLAMLCLHNTIGGVIRFVKLYNYIILLMAIGGAICFFMVFLCSFRPLFEFQNVDGRTAYCFGLTCTNTYVGNVIRYAGYFDEPGAMAYWGIFALLFNRLFFNNRRYEWLLIFCLIFTFSLAYYIQVFFYLIFFSIKRSRDVLLLIGVLSLIIGGIFLSKDTDYDVYRFTLYRFEINETTGQFEGDNRSGLSEKAKTQFFKAPILGIGAQNMDAIDYMADNPYEILAKDGIIGQIVTYLPLIFIAVYGLKTNKKYLYASIILALGYLQRPFHVDIIHPIMLYMFFSSTIEYYYKFEYNRLWKSH